MPEVLTPGSVLLVATDDQLRRIIREELEQSGLMTADVPMNCTEAAKFLKTSVWSIRRKCKTHKIKAKKDGRDWIILRSELLKHAEGQ